MSDDLRDLGHRLVADPPHPAPSVDELHDRVARRRQRRARAIGAVSVLVLVVVAGAVLALPRTSSLDVSGTGIQRSSPPPPLVAGPVQLTVTPQSAPLSTSRSIQISNTGTEPYFTCLVYNLFRWSGTEWEPVALLYLDGSAQSGKAPTLRPYEPMPPSVDCGVMAVEAGSTKTFPFTVGLASWHPEDGTTPPRTDELIEGWYELREVVAATDEPTPGMGRFEVASDTPASPPPSAPTGVDAPIGTVTVDLYPDELTAAVEVLPNTVFAVDQNTIAIAWTGPCNQPAEQVTFAARDGEIELRLRVGTFEVIDCVGEPDDWVATFDVPFTITDRVRLVARAEGVDGETERLPELIMGSLGGGSQLPDGTPTSFRATEVTDPAEPGVRFVRVQLTDPLAGRVACDVSMSTSNRLAIPAVQVQEASAAGLPPCSDVQNTIRLSPFATIIGQP